MDQQEILELFYQEEKKYPLLSQKETNALLNKYQKENDQEAYEKLVIHNLGLAIVMAKNFENHCRTMNLLDLIQENYFILRKAIARFDMNRGYKLSTYVCRSMRSGLQRKIDQKDDIIKIPKDTKGQERKYYKYQRDYYQKFGKDPSQKEIKEGTKIDFKTQQKIKNLALFSPLLLNQEIMKDEVGIKEDIIDYIESPKNEIEEFEESSDLLILLRSLCDFLDGREYYIIYYQTIEPLTQVELGKRLEITSEQVRKIAKKSFQKIKPVLSKIEKKTLETYGIGRIDTKELIPLDPKPRIGLYYLKDKIDSLSYQMVYTKFCNEGQDSLEYYQSYFPEIDATYIEQLLEKIPQFIMNFFTDENLDAIYQKARQNLKVQEIMNLDICPESSVKQEYTIPFLEAQKILGVKIEDKWFGKNQDNGTIKKNPYTK